MTPPDALRREEEDRATEERKKASGLIKVEEEEEEEEGEEEGQSQPSLPNDQTRREREWLVALRISLIALEAPALSVASFKMVSTLSSMTEALDMNCDLRVGWALNLSLARAHEVLARRRRD